MNLLSEMSKLTRAMHSLPFSEVNCLEFMLHFKVRVLATKRFLAMEFPTHLWGKHRLCNFPPIFSQKYKALMDALKVVSLCNCHVFAMYSKLLKTVCSVDWLYIVLKDSPITTHIQSLQKGVG